VITGLVTIDSGDIKILGRDIQDSEVVSSHVGALIEYPGFLPQFSGLKNLILLGSIRNKVTKAKIHEAMYSLGLDPNDKRPYRKYSLGMRQKLGIAAAIMENPDIVLLDEPTNNIDAESVSVLYQIIKDYNTKNRTTFIMTSHHMGDIDELCNKVFKIQKGELSLLR